MNNTGFAVTGSSILKSTDGGNNWASISSVLNILNIGMGSETNAAFAIQPQKIVFTQNGGTSLDTVNLSDMSISDVFFVSPTMHMPLVTAYGKLPMRVRIGQNFMTFRLRIKERTRRYIF